MFNTRMKYNILLSRSHFNYCNFAYIIIILFFQYLHVFRTRISFCLLVSNYYAADGLYTNSETVKTVVIDDCI